MQKKIFLKSLIILILACLLTIGCLFAYFTVNGLKSPQEHFTLETNTIGHTIIKNENDLILASKYSYYEAFTDTSVLVLRKNLIFANNIKLSENLLIDSDVNINLSGFTLDLNGKNLLIRHNFYGNLTIFNGEITDTSVGGKLIVETPNAVLFLADNLIYPNGLVEVRQFDFAAASEEFYNDLDNLLIHFQENGVSVGYFIDDLPYFSSYKGLPLDIEYISDKPNVVDSYGRINQQSLDEKVTLTVKISDKTGTFETKDYNIVILKINSDNLNIGQKIIEDYFLRYLIIEEGIYFYNQPIALITAIDYYGLSFSYEDESKVNLNNNILNIGASNSPNKVTVTITHKDGYAKSETYTFMSFSETNYEIMNAFVNKIGNISIINTTSEVVLITKPQEISHNIRDIEYILSNGAEVYYEIIKRINQDTNEEETVLIVKRLPTIYDRFNLTVKLSFISGTPLELEKNISIVLTNSGGSGGTGEGDDFYNNIYTNLNVKLADITKNGLVNEIRLSTEEDGVKIKYVIEGNENGEILHPFIRIDANDGGRFIIDTTLLPIIESDIVIKIYFGAEEKLYDRTLHFSLLGVLQKIRDIKDENLYNLILNLSDINVDDILTVNEAKLFNLPLSLDGSSPINNFSGLLYLENLEEIIIKNNNINFVQAEDGLFYNIIGDNIKRLTLNNCGITDTDFANMTNLVYLDISNNGQSNKNTLNNLSGLPLFPNLTIINLNNIDFISYEGIEKQLRLNKIYLDNDEVLLKPLIDIKYLEKVVLNGNGILNEYNVTSYVIMFRKNVKFVIGESEIPLAPPTAEEKEGAEILESIIYFNSGKILTLPVRLGEYPIIWKDILSGIILDLSGAVNNEISISNLSGTIKLEAAVTVRNITVKKQFIIIMES